MRSRLPSLVKYAALWDAFFKSSYRLQIMLAALADCYSEPWQGWQGCHQRIWIYPLFDLKCMKNIQGCRFWGTISNFYPILGYFWPILCNTVYGGSPEGWPKDMGRAPTRSQQTFELLPLNCQRLPFLLSLEWLSKVPAITFVLPIKGLSK